MIGSTGRALSRSTKWRCRSLSSSVTASDQHHDPVPQADRTSTSTIKPSLDELAMQVENFGDRRVNAANHHQINDPRSQYATRPSPSNMLPSSINTATTSASPLHQPRQQQSLEAPRNTKATSFPRDATQLFSAHQPTTSQEQERRAYPYSHHQQQHQQQQQQSGGSSLRQAFNRFSARQSPMFKQQQHYGPRQQTPQSPVQQRHSPNQHQRGQHHQWQQRDSRYPHSSFQNQQQQSRSQHQQQPVSQRHLSPTRQNPPHVPQHGSQQLQQVLGPQSSFPYSNSQQEPSPWPHPSSQQAPDQKHQSVWLPPADRKTFQQKQTFSQPPRTSPQQSQQSSFSPGFGQTFQRQGLQQQQQRQPSAAAGQQNRVPFLEDFSALLRKSYKKPDGSSVLPRLETAGSERQHLVFRKEQASPETEDSIARLRRVFARKKPKPDELGALPHPRKPSFVSSLDTPLTDLIRSINFENAKKKKDDDESNSFPIWRRSTEPDRIVNRNRRRQYPPSPPKTERKGHTPVYIDPKQQVVTLPYYDISLAEASLLFRTKTRNLTNLVKQLGVDVANKRTLMLSPDTLELIAVELGHKYEKMDQPEATDDAERLMQRRAIDTEQYPSRPAVVAVMGHVDHGKTTLMDALRRRANNGGAEKKSNKTKNDKKRAKPPQGGDVAGTEAGGITQVITAFQVPLLEPVEGGRDAVTFLDTPGHAAFKSMRQSGSYAADIIVLVVAADDGVSPQTIEIINLYMSIVKGAGGGGISLVVALNKIDKPGIDVEESKARVASQLLEQGIVTEENMPSDPEALSDFNIVGPPVQMIPVSGLTGSGLDDLIEGLALQSEFMELRADNAAPAEGVVMDASVDKGLGIVADCIIRWGSLQQGDIVVSGTCTGKVRILKEVGGNQQVEKGLPSQPVRIIGFDSVPKAGDPIICVESEAAAQELVTKRKAAAAKNEDLVAADQTGAELQSSGRHMMNQEWKNALEKKYGIDDTEDDVIRIPVVVKADADGTLAAVRDALVELGKQSSHNVVVDPILAKVGPLLSTEVQVARDCQATVFCFNVKQKEVADDLPIFQNDVIYRLLDDAKVAFAKYLPAEPVEVVHGRGRVQTVFSIGGINEKVAGLMVTDGTMYKSKADSHYRVVRNGRTLGDELSASSLKHFKGDVDEVGRGKECGVSLSGFNDYEEGDEIECYAIELRRPQL